MSRRCGSRSARLTRTGLGVLFGIVFLSHQVGAFVGVWLGSERRVPVPALATA